MSASSSTGSGVADFAIERFAIGGTSTSADASLLPGAPSRFGPLTVASFVWRVPEAAGRTSTTTSTSALAPLASAPMSQVTTVGLLPV
jgi:hypothetical protein